MNPSPPIATDLAAVVHGVTKSFGDRHVLADLDVTVAQGEFVALLGASGSGKTTLLRILAGLETAGAGDVLVPDVRTVVFQEPRLVVSLRVWRNVVLGLPRAQATRERAVSALQEVGLAPQADSWPGTLSGGEAQRVALARALVREPQLLLLDEPFAALDALTRLRMQQLVADLCARHRPGVLLVTHDVEEAVLLADRVMVLTDGRISLDQPVELSRPRRVGGEEFDELRDRLLAELGVLAGAAEPFGGPRPSHARGPPEPSAHRRVTLGRHLGEPAAGNPRILARHDLVVVEPVGVDGGRTIREHDDAVHGAPRLQPLAGPAEDDVGDPVQRWSERIVGLGHPLRDLVAAVPVADLAVVSIAVVGKTRPEQCPVPAVDPTGIANQEFADGLAQLSTNRILHQLSF